MGYMIGRDAEDFALRNNVRLQSEGGFIDALDARVADRVWLEIVEPDGNCFVCGNSSADDVPQAAVGIVQPDGVTGLCCDCWEQTGGDEIPVYVTRDIS